MEAAPSKSLKGDVDTKAREPVHQTRAAIEIEILDSDVSQDHVHAVTSALPKRTPAEIMGQMGRSLKNKVSMKLVFEGELTE